MAYLIPPDCDNTVLFMEYLMLVDHTMYFEYTEQGINNSMFVKHGTVTYIWAFKSPNDSLGFLRISNGNCLNIVFQLNIECV